MTRRLCHADERKGETAVHGCHCPSDMAVRMREVLARPWVGVCVPLALSLSRLLVYLTVLGYACAYTFGSSGFGCEGSGVHEPLPYSSLSATEVPSPWCRDSWLGGAFVPAMGALFQSRDWLPKVH